MMSTSTQKKRPSADGGDNSPSQPPTKKGHWSLGLLDSMNDPKLQVYKDDDMVIIKDKYPKVRHDGKYPHWSLGLLDSMNDPKLQVYKDDDMVIIEKYKYPKVRHDGKYPHWSLGLLDSMNDPKLQVYKDDDMVIIEDKYPKAQFHYLVLPKVNIPRLKALKPEHLDLLKSMHKVADKFMKEAIEESKTDVKYRLGYHAIPSMSHLHLHAISQDFNSPTLKTKKHWNSFTSEYFVDSKDVINQLESDGKVDTSSRKPDELLKLPLRCHVCKVSLANMPKLKAHILTHIKSR